MVFNFNYDIPLPMNLGFLEMIKYHSTIKHKNCMDLAIYSIFEHHESKFFWLIVNERHLQKDELKLNYAIIFDIIQNHDYVLLQNFRHHGQCR